jgi:hypothetical protein
MEYLTDEDYVIAAENGINRKTAYHRFYVQCWEKEKAINTPVTHYPGIWAKCKKQSKVSKDTFYRRVRNGMAPKEAASIPPLPAGNPNKGTGKITDKHLTLAAEKGISERTVKARVYAYRWPVELAITVPIGSKRPMRGRLKA